MTNSKDNDHEENIWIPSPTAHLPLLVIIKDIPFAPGPSKLFHLHSAELVANTARPISARVGHYIPAALVSLAH